MVARNGLFGWLRRWRRSRKGLTLPAGWRRYLASLPFGGFSELVNDAYFSNATVFACMQILQQTFTEPELWAWERGGDRNEFKPVQGHPLRKLMARPNSDMGEAELLQFVIAYAPLSGNAYLWKQRVGDRRYGRVTALWPLHDGQITPVPGQSTSEGFVAYYVLQGAQSSNPWGIERHDNITGIAIPKSEIVHWKWAIDPLNPHRGIGALEASAGDVRVANEIRDYVYSYLKNDAVPPVVVTLVEGDELTEEKAKRLRKMWKQVYGGPNRGTPAFLEAGMNAKTLGSNLREMDLSSLRDGPDAAVCMGFHIHPAVVGALVGLKHSTYNNMGEANRALALQTLVPLWRSFASEVQQSMAGEPGYAEDVVIRFDLSQVRALQDSQNAIEERLGRAFDRGGITRAEYRRALGYDVTPEDDVFKENLASVWVRRGQLRTADPELLQAEQDRQQDGKQKKDAPFDAAQGKPFDAAQGKRRSGQVLRDIRARLVSKMAARLTGYFRGLGEHVEAQLTSEKSLKASDAAADDLLAAADDGELERILKQFYLTILELSWDFWNVSLGVHLVFDMNDPLVTQILAMAGQRVKDIHKTTRQALAEVLQYGSEHGWGIDDLIRGDAEAGVPGIREVVEQTYAGRAENIARTELGTAQNAATAARYRDAGVDLVEILDNGEDDDDAPCRIANGQVWTVAYFAAHPLEHPRCTRAAAPYFGDREPDRS